MDEEQPSSKVLYRERMLCWHRKISISKYGVPKLSLIDVRWQRTWLCQDTYYPICERMHLSLGWSRHITPGLPTVVTEWLLCCTAEHEVAGLIPSHGSHILMEAKCKNACVLCFAYTLKKPRWSKLMWYLSLRCSSLSRDIKPYNLNCCFRDRHQRIHNGSHFPLFAVSTFYKESEAVF